MSNPPGTGWVGYFGTYNYNAPYFTGPAIPESENPGDNYSWKHGVSDGNYSGPLTQTVNLSPTLTEAQIDAGQGQFTFSAWMASWSGNDERPYITLQFFDSSGTTQLGGTTVLDRNSALNFVRFADETTTFDLTTHEDHWAKYVRTAGIPSGARSARVGITHNPTLGFSGGPDTYTDLVKLEVQAVAAQPPSLESAAPTGSDVRPDAAIQITLTDGSTQVDLDSIRLRWDGVAVNAAIEKSGAITTITYDPPGLLPAASAHNYQITFADNGAVPASQTNEFNFTVSSYYPILLPAPIHLETFDATSEGSLPEDWAHITYSAVPDPNCNPTGPDIGTLQDLNSACYAQWTVVNSARFNSPMLTYGSHTEETDYRRVLSVNPLNVVNGAVVENLAQNNIAFGNSGYRDGGSQVVYLFSKDYDLTGHNNVYLVFHSIWEQNQDSMGAVEYSVDQGATWLPLTYLLHSADVVRDGNGNIDAAATFTMAHGDTATYTDPDDGSIKGGHYGAFIGVDSSRWATLAPYISGRADDDPVESKRVEVFRLPAADNAATVRLRFAHAGADSWYFGLDNVGFYSLTSVAPPLLSVTPTNGIEHVGNSFAFNSTALGIGPFTYQWRHNGSDIPGATEPTLAITVPNTAAAGTYTLRVSYPGGVAERSATLAVLPPAMALVTGQWDFEAYDLRATYGTELDPHDNYVGANTILTDSEFEGIAGIDDQLTTFLKFPGVGESITSGYRMRHGILANGGGTNVNQYTLIMDLYYPDTSHNLERGLLQTNPNNTDNRDIAIGANNGLGVTDGFQGQFLANTWQRIAIAVDLAGPGPHPIMAKFINGVKVGQQVLSEGRDGRWSLKPADDPLTPWALLFADDTFEAQLGFVSSIQIRNGRLADAQIARLGGPSARKIPGAVHLSWEGAQLKIEWSGGVPLESADAITGPWTEVGGAFTPYFVPNPLGQGKFYRPKL